MGIQLYFPDQDIISKFFGDEPEKVDPELVLICGPACIGKSYFLNYHGFNKHMTVRSSFFAPGSSISVKSILRFAKRDALRSRKINVHMIINCHPDNWNSGNNLNSSKQRLIILGVPYSEYLERTKKRKSKFVLSVDKYEEVYVEWITEVDRQNFSYIFVDGRNDYPILDKSSFFTMITGSTPI